MPHSGLTQASAAFDRPLSEALAFLGSAGLLAGYGSVASVSAQSLRVQLANGGGKAAFDPVCSTQDCSELSLRKAWRVARHSQVACPPPLLYSP